MKVAVGADHAGFPLKGRLLEFIGGLGHEPIDLGTHSTDPVDYPDIAKAVGDAIQEGRAARAVLLCGSGVGASIAASKMRGVRACVCHDTYSAHQGVEHDSMNVIALGARVIGAELALELVAAFLAAHFTGEERHERRLRKVADLERSRGQGSGQGPGEGQGSGHGSGEGEGEGGGEGEGEGERHTRRRK